MLLTTLSAIAVYYDINKVDFYLHKLIFQSKILTLKRGLGLCYAALFKICFGTKDWK